MNEVTILVIDDESAIRFALVAVIESQGWCAVAAEGVAHGLKQMSEHNPDLILIDYHMPQINGLEGVAMIKKRNPTVPIIVFTIDENQQLADKFIEAGASDFAIKPIKAPDIVSRIKLHIQLLASNRKQEISLNTAPTTKGIGLSTLQLIQGTMEESKEFLTVEEISKRSGLAYQTTYRYLQYMVTENIVEIQVNYGKVGRPKQGYRLL